MPRSHDLARHFNSLASLGPDTTPPPCTPSARSGARGSAMRLTGIPGPGSLASMVDPSFGKMRARHERSKDAGGKNLWQTLLRIRVRVLVKCLCPPQNWRGGTWLKQKRRQSYLIDIGFSETPSKAHIEPRVPSSGSFPNICHSRAPQRRKDSGCGRSRGLSEGSIKNTVAS